MRACVLPLLCALFFPAGLGGAPANALGVGGPHMLVPPRVDLSSTRQQPSRQDSSEGWDPSLGGVVPDVI